MTYAGRGGGGDSCFSGASEGDAGTEMDRAYTKSRIVSADQSIDPPSFQLFNVLRKIYDYEQNRRRPYGHQTGARDQQFRGKILLLYCSVIYPQGLQRETMSHGEYKPPTRR